MHGTRDRGTRGATKIKPEDIEEIVDIPRMSIPADARQLRDFGTMRDYLRIRWEEMQAERRYGRDQDRRLYRTTFLGRLNHVDALLAKDFPE
jgi:hypothetical protein